jgi:streptogramin lyase
LTLDARIGQPTALAVDSGGVWVTGYALEEGPATVEHISTSTGEVLAKVELADNAAGPIVVGDDAIWVSTQQNEESAHVIKIDPDTAKIKAVIPTQGVATVAITPDAVWIDDSAGTLLRLDPDTNAIVATIPLPGGPYSAHWITAGPLGIFLANSYDDTVLRVDPITNTVRRFAEVCCGVGAIVELDGSLWIGAGSSVLYELNPATGALERRIDLGLHMHGLFRASDGRSLWMRTDRPRVVRVDPRSGRTTPVPLPDGVGNVADFSADPGTGAVWVAVNDPTPQVLRLAP